MISLYRIYSCELVVLIMSAFSEERFEINLDDSSNVNDGNDGSNVNDGNDINDLNDSIEYDIPSINRDGPIVVLVIGMAGSGKTTLMHRLNLHMLETNKKGYYVNLDPAVTTTPFGANIDIRDTVNYKEVMKQYGLGPNGGILTSLNLFATRFGQVIEILERRCGDLDYIFVDTPGQIETFTWSAGGQIIHELLASSFPTTILYIVDTPRCSSPTTFMSNMLYACSVLYKSRLPMICVFNKIDCVSCGFAEEWMNDFEAYQTALDADSEEYMGTLNRSLSLVMDEFYKNIRRIGVSAVSGQGIAQLFENIDGTVAEFKESYIPELKKRFREKKAMENKQKEIQIQRIREDIKNSKGDSII